MNVRCLSSELALSASVEFAALTGDIHKFWQQPAANLKIFQGFSLTATSTKTCTKYGFIDGWMVDNPSMRKEGIQANNVILDKG